MIYLLLFHNREMKKHRERLVFGFSRIRVIISPADKHDHASTHDVETSSLFFDQPRALPCKSASPLFVCLLAAVHGDRRRGGGACDPRRAAA